MHFFSSREGASKWANERPGTAILTVEEAFRLAREVWIEPWQALEG